MPIQIIPANNRQKPLSFAQSIAGGLAESIPGAIEKKQAASRMEQENAAARRMGIDLSGFTDPKQRQEIVSQHLKGKNQQKLQGLKATDEQGILEQKQSYLDKILNSNKKNLDKKNFDLNVEEQQEKGLSEEFKPQDISDKDIIKAEALGLKGLREAKDAALKKIENEKKGKRDIFESDRDYHSKGSDPIVKAAEGVVRESPIKKALISQQKRDIASGNTEGIIPFMVDKLGLEAYRNPESARFKTASKERFVASVHELGSSGARANQFIEQQLVSAQAALGRSAEANESVLDLEEFIIDAKETRAQYELDLANKDVEELGYVRRDIVNRADKLMKPYIEQRQDEMAYDIRKRHEETMDDESLTKEIVSGKISADTPLTLRAARILMIKNNDDEKKAQAEAKKLGFKFPSEKTYQR